MGLPSHPISLPFQTTNIGGSVIRDMNGKLLLHLGATGVVAHFALTGKM